MSFQATTWAIDQRTGSPSGKATLWSIANYANANWFSYPKQETIAAESEQSVDSVQRRLTELQARGLLRRIKLKRFGRRTHDFIILQPSPFFAAAIDDIRQFLPSGCDLLEDGAEAENAAADCGSAAGGTAPDSAGDSEPGAAADCGSVTLPQSAADAAASVRQQEPVIEPKNPPQTPPDGGASPGQPDEEKGGDLEGFDECLRTYGFHSTGPVCSNIEAAQALWRPLDRAQRAQAQHGATGIAAVRARDPKRRGIVGFERFLRSSALWAEYGRFAPAEKAPPPPRVFVPLGSEAWRAWAVIFAIFGQRMPDRRGEAGVTGADFLGELPASGLVLARYADQHGGVDQSDWILLHVAASETSRDRWSVAEQRDRPRFAAWRDRLRECTGKTLAAGILDSGETSRQVINGKEYLMPRKFRGVRVPASWPPPKGGDADATRAGDALATDDDLDHLAEHG